MVGFGKLTPPIPSSALPPQDYLEAVPKYISGRTSYLRVRLAFYPYPQLIPAFCTIHGFGPSLRYYRSFNLAMGSSPGFGSNPDNLPAIMVTPHSVSIPGLVFAPINRDSTIPKTYAGCFATDWKRPIRTRFRCGSGTSIP